MREQRLKEGGLAEAQNRAGRLQFVTDPASGHVVSAMEHTANESAKAKTYLISEALKMQR